VLRDRIAAVNASADAEAEALLQPFRPVAGFTPMPRHDHLRRLARRWRALPAFGRLRLVAKFDFGKLQIVELRVAPAGIVAAGWSEEEPAFAVMLRTVAIAPPEFVETTRLLAAVGLHGLARRFERGADRTDDAVLRDLLPLACGCPAAIRAGGDFAIPVPGTGAWIGAIAADGATALARTFVDG